MEYRDCYCLRLFCLMYNGGYLSMHLIKPKEYAIQRMNSSVNSGLELIIKYQCWLINYNKCTTLMQNSNNNQKPCV